MLISAFFEDGFTDLLLGHLLFPIILAVILIIGITIVIRIGSKQGKIQRRTARMLADDSAANSVRLKKIDPSYFFVPNVDELPFKEYSDEDIKKPQGTYLWQKKALDASAKKMLHFDEEYSNTELKKMFGAANLEFVARYEENFTNYIHTLRNWAQALINDGFKDDAQKVLEFAAKAGSEVSQTYIMLADIYAEKNDNQALQSLKNTLATRRIPAKDAAITHIEKYLF
ncbi:MAG: hypothetical protein FWE33_02215 [Defluviitaleaceae bacterium]|nr:hypothetical protein [Defluviitaleaceae bacterium]